MSQLPGDKLISSCRREEGSERRRGLLPGEEGEAGETGETERWADSRAQEAAGGQGQAGDSLEGEHPGSQVWARRPGGRDSQVCQQPATPRQHQEERDDWSHSQGSDTPGTGGAHTEQIQS